MTVSRAMLLASALAATYGIGLPAPMVIDFSSSPQALTLHRATVHHGALVLDASRNAWASIKLPADLWHWPGIRISARFRLSKLAPGQVPAMVHGRAGLYVASNGQVYGMYWASDRRHALVSKPVVHAGRWHELLLEYRQDGLVSLYLDGTLLARYLALDPLDRGEATLTIGRWKWQERGQWHYAHMSGEVAWVKVGPPQSPPLRQTTPRIRMAKAVSWGDIILEGEAIDKDSIRCHLDGIAQDGFQVVHWRVSSAILRTWHTRAAQHLWVPYIRRYYSLVDSIYSRFDPIDVACASAHKLGLKLYGWLTIFDEGAPPSVLYAGSVPFPWQSKFTAEHPEYLVRDPNGNPHWGVLEYAYPEARRYKVRQIVEIATRYNLDGIFVSTRSHSPPAQHGDRFGFNKPIVDEFRRRYGQDVLGGEFDREAWRRLRGEQITKLLRELRAALPPKLKLCIGIPRGDHFGPPYGNMFIDWRTWVRERLIDELVIGEISGKALWPNVKEYAGYIFDQEAGVGVRPLDEDIRHVFGPACRQAGVHLYTGPAQDPSFWRLVEEGWCDLRL